jgi:hypothetical protein
MLVPVFFLLPGLPVLFEMPVGDALMPWRHMTVIGRQVDQDSRDPDRLDIDPRTIVARGSMPAPLVRPIPVAMIEQNVRLNVGDKIDIGLGYNDDRRRCRNHDRRRRTKIHSDVYVNTGNAMAGELQKGENQDHNKHHT